VVTLQAVTPWQLRIARHQAELTQGQMAQLIGISRNSLSRYERGGRRIPKVVAKAAKCAIEHELGWEIPQLPPKKGKVRP